MKHQAAQRFDGVRFGRGLDEAASWLESQTDEINALNVFPVPDGDTGTNMSLTFRAAVREALTISESSHIGHVARAAAHGALLGARGNSGVILSQFLRGIARSLEKNSDASPLELAQALLQGSTTASKAVIKPVEGTMLTVGRDATQAAVQAAEAGATVEGVFEAAVSEARASVARTPSLLPVLKQAGVVDAGGQGLLVILEGISLSLKGMTRSAPGASAPVATSAVHKQTRVEQETPFGYCTEFLIRARESEGQTRLDIDSIREKIVTFGDSALVVGEDNIARVHVHTFRPGLVLEYAVSVGTLHRVKIDNMQEQHEHILHNLEEIAAVQPTSAGLDPNGTSIGFRKQKEPTPSVALSLVAVVSGEGFIEILRGLGVTDFVRGGQTMNPSTEELLRAVEESPGESVLLLPNNSNIQMAAKQVRLLTEKPIAILPTRDQAQGVAAALAFSLERDLAANVHAMEAALRSVKTAEITQAIRSAKLGGFEIKPGEIVGLTNDQIIAAGEELEPVVLATLDWLEAQEADLITVYAGDESLSQGCDELVETIRRLYPDAEVELHSGGQPLYHYLMAVE